VRKQNQIHTLNAQHYKEQIFDKIKGF